VLDVIAPQVSTTQTRLVLGDTPLEAKIIELIQQGMNEGECTSKGKRGRASEFLQTLTLMELKGTVRNLGAQPLESLLIISNFCAVIYIAIYVRSY
jgi:hypothetical protein